VKDVTCPACGVPAEVPNEARAYRCANCWALVEGLSTGRPRVRNPVTTTLWTVATVIVGLVLFAMIANLVLSLFELWLA
jgi:hypothetical protein